MTVREFRVGDVVSIRGGSEPVVGYITGFREVEIGYYRYVGGEAVFSTYMETVPVVRTTEGSVRSVAPEYLRYIGSI